LNERRSAIRESGNDLLLIAVLSLIGRSNELITSRMDSANRRGPTPFLTERLAQFVHEPGERARPNRKTTPELSDEFLASNDARPVSHQLDQEVENLWPECDTLTITCQRITFFIEFETRESDLHEDDNYHP
jgi:hypothetical protein